MRGAAAPPVEQPGVRADGEYYGDSDCENENPVLGAYIPSRDRALRPVGPADDEPDEDGVSTPDTMPRPAAAAAAARPPWADAADECSQEDNPGAWSREAFQRNKSGAFAMPAGAQVVPPGPNGRRVAHCKDSGWLCTDGKGDYAYEFFYGAKVLARTSADGGKK